MGWNKTPLTDDEALALMEAVNKAMKPNLDDAKNEARQRLLDQFAEDGKTDRQGIFIDGEKVGDVSIRYNGGTVAIVPGMEAEALAYLKRIGLTKVIPAKGWEGRFSRVGDAVADNETGEIVDWAWFQPKTAGTAAVSGCKPDAVFPALKAKLGTQSVAGLLLGGEL